MADRKSRRTYTKDFKLEAVRLASSRDNKTSDVARNLGLSANTLNRWVREYHADTQYAFPGHGNLKEPEEELRQLRKELADTRMERDILKKALAVFSRQSPRNFSLFGKTRKFSRPTRSVKRCASARAVTTVGPIEPPVDEQLRMPDYWKGSERSTKTPRKPMAVPA
jgi:transposase